MPVSGHAMSSGARSAPNEVRLPGSAKRRFARETALVSERLLPACSGAELLKRAAAARRRALGSSRVPMLWFRFVGRVSLLITSLVVTACGGRVDSGSPWDRDAQPVSAQLDQEPVEAASTSETSAAETPAASAGLVVSPQDPPGQATQSDIGVECEATLMLFEGGDDPAACSFIVDDPLAVESLLNGQGQLSMRDPDFASDVTLARLDEASCVEHAEAQEEALKRLAPTPLPLPEEAGGAWSAAFDEPVAMVSLCYDACDALRSSQMSLVLTFQHGLLCQPVTIR